MPRNNRIALCLLALLATGRGAQALGDATRGEQIYQSCQDCHTLDENDVGPKHRGVFGRRAGSVADYNYSAALKNSGIVWDEQTLDKWLQGPKLLVPGTKMGFVLSGAQDRADVIEYLRTIAK